MIISKEIQNRRIRFVQQKNGGDCLTLYTSEIVLFANLLLYVFQY